MENITLIHTPRNQLELAANHFNNGEYYLHIAKDSNTAALEFKKAEEALDNASEDLSEITDYHLMISKMKMYESVIFGPMR